MRCSHRLQQMFLVACGPSWCLGLQHNNMSAILASLSARLAEPARHVMVVSTTVC
jgi:hypothetical protein